MSIYATPADTLIGQNLNTQKTIKELEKNLVGTEVLHNHLDVLAEFPIQPIGLMGNCNAAVKTPFFTNPLQISINDKKYLVMDFRPFTTAIGKGCDFSQVRIRSGSEYYLTRDRLVFSLDWLLSVEVNKEINLGRWKNGFRYAVFIFGKWISNILTQRFSLDPEETLKIDILANYFYLTLFESANTFPETEKHRFLLHIIKNTNAKPEYIKSVIDQIDYMSGLNDFCEAIKIILDNVKLEGFNASILITITSNSWFGINSKELIAVALEYPPEFITILYYAINEKTYKHSYLANIASRYVKNTNAREFTLNYKTLLSSYLVNS